MEQTPLNLLKLYAQARMRLDRARKAYMGRETQKGPWMPLLDELTQAQQEEEELFEAVRVFIETC